MTLAMYRVGQEVEIDVITNVEALLDDSVFEVESQWNISIEQNWALLNVKYSAVLIPINYD